MEGIVLHKNAIAIDVNAAMARMVGYTREDLLGKNFMELFHKDDLAIIRENMGKEYAPPYTVRMAKKNGEYFFAEVESHNFQKQDEMWRVSAIRDITERKRAEEALRESENLFRLTFKSSPDAINLNRLDDGLYVDINDGFTKITGYTRADVLGDTSLTLNIWNDLADRQQLVQELLKKGFVENLETQFRRKDGKLITGLMSARVISLNGVPHIISISRDISERKALEEEKKKLQNELIQAQKMEAIGTLAGGIAHDFNNILGAILGYAEMVQEDSPAGSRTRSDIDQVVKASHRAKELVKQILNFSRQAATEQIPLHPALIIKEVVKMLRSSLPST